MQFNNDRGRNVRDFNLVDRDWPRTRKTRTRNARPLYLRKKEKPHAAEWGYTGKTGPRFWGDLSPQYSLAKTGKHQSPIDLKGSVVQRLPKLTFDYKPSRIQLIYNGHSVQENEDPGGFGMVNGKQFQLQQFHFHSPSEHTIDGKQFPMEMHLVHQSEDGNLGVVSVLIEAGKHNKAFDPIWDMLPNADLPSRNSEAKIDTMALLPKDYSYYSYDGSLTTPPCTERVKWAVLTTPVSLSMEQIVRFRSVIHGNNRPVQPLYGRKVTRSKGQ